MYIVGFNGPPRSGKDTMARMLAEHLDSVTNLPVKEVSLSTPLRRIAYAMVGFIGQLDGPDYERFKTTWFPQFDRDGRHLMIDVSESFLKQTYGQEIMANLLLEELGDFKGIALIRDCGFQCEISALAKALGFRSIFIVQVTRSGYDFSNDSREWVSHPFAKRWDNDFGLDELRVGARLIIDDVRKMGWTL